MISEQERTIAFRQVYKEYAPALFHFAEKFVSSFYVEDVVHDVFLKLWDKQVFLLEPNELQRILYVAVRHASIDHLRRQHLESEYADKRAYQLKLEELDYFKASDELFMRQDLMNLLMQEIEKLPTRNREIFRMYYLEELKTTEIANRLSLSVRTVENQLYRALLSLRKKSSRLFFFLFMFI